MSSPVSVMTDGRNGWASVRGGQTANGRSEEHTSELQSRRDLVCRLLLEKKKKNTLYNLRLHREAQPLLRIQRSQGAFCRDTSHVLIRSDSMRRFVVGTRVRRISLYHANS